MPVENAISLPEYAEIQIGNNTFIVCSYYSTEDASLIEKIKHLLKEEISSGMGQ